MSRVNTPDAKPYSVALALCSTLSTSLNEGDWGKGSLQCCFLSCYNKKKKSKNKSMKYTVKSTTNHSSLLEAEFI